VRMQVGNRNLNLGDNTTVQHNNTVQQHSTTVQCITKAMVTKVVVLPNGDTDSLVATMEGTLCALLAPKGNSTWTPLGSRELDSLVDQLIGIISECYFSLYT